jgi:hypothetical protein
MAASKPQRPLQPTAVMVGEFPLLADSVEKVGFSARLNSGTAFSGEPTHHIEWFLGPSLTFAALLLG